MTIGTKSLLFGVHQVLIHPWFVAWAWWRLYSFPWDPRLWVAFFVHDWGYWGKPDMDGEEGERHVVLGGRIMHRLFDARYSWFWGDFCLLHSRFWAKKCGMPVSRLCFADKLSICLTPAWLYLPLARLSGEIYEYMGHSTMMDSRSYYYQRKWYRAMQSYVADWVDAHKDGREDTWTKAGQRGELTRKTP